MVFSVVSLIDPITIKSGRRYRHSFCHQPQGWLAWPRSRVMGTAAAGVNRLTEGGLAMRNRGKGPKDVFVRKYPRWVKGERKRVGNHKRGADANPALRPSELQLDFGFDPSGSAR